MIIISGMAKVGKTALANLLAKEAFELGFKPTILPFAGTLKEEAASRGFTKEDKPAEYREFCQVHGALKREVDPDYWVKKFEEKLIDLYKEEVSDLQEGCSYWQKVVIVDDCRYENELALAQKHKACSLFVSPGNRTLDDMDGEWRNHHSENMARRIEDGDDELLSDFNFVITNDGTEKDLEYQVETMAPIWLGIQACPDYQNEETAQAMTEIVDLFIDMVFEKEEEEEEDDDYLSP